MESSRPATSSPGVIVKTTRQGQSLPQQRLSMAMILFAASCPVGIRAETPRQFRVWAVSCSHVPADIRGGREGLAKAIRHSEGLEDEALAFD